MCNAMALQIGGMAFSVIGSVNQAKAQQNSYNSQAQVQQNQYNYQAQVAANNATMAEYQARDAIKQGQREEQNQRLKAAALLSDQRAQLAANGIDLGEGTATDLLTTTKFMGEHDALTIRDNASRKAWAYRVQSSSYSDEEAMRKSVATGMDTTSGGGINPTMVGVTSLLSSAGSVSEKWYTAKKTGTDLTKSFWD